MLGPKPKNERRQRHENTGHAKGPTVTRFLAQQWNDKKSERRADVNGPIKPAVNFPQGTVLIRTELITHERRYTGFYTSGAYGDERQSRVQSRPAAFKEGEATVAQAVKKRDAKNRPVASQPTIRQPTADQRKEIDCRREQVQ